MPRVFIGVGSNEGDRFKQISTALSAIAATPGIRLLQVAPIIETEPVGGPAQENYLNTAIEIETAIAPVDLLKALKAIEKKQGRNLNAQRWSARTIDLDILFYGDQVLETPDLVIPHPLMPKRLFVLEPLNELAGDFLHPALKQTVRSLLAQLQGNCCDA